MVSTFPPRRCGIGDYTAELTTAFVRAGRVQLRIETYPDGLDPGVIEEDGFQVSRKLGGDHVAENVASDIAAFGPDIVHLQSSTFLHSPAVNRAVADACEVPLVTTVHDTPRSWRVFYTIPALRKIYSKSARVIVHSTAVARALADFHHVDRRKLVRIPHGVDVDEISPTTSAEGARKQYDLHGHRIVLFFGFLRPGKGLEQLLEAWSLIEKSNPDALLVVAGGTPTKARKYFLNMRDEASYPMTLRQHAEALGIATRVKFTGFVPADLVSGLLSSADVIVLPYEGQASQSGPLHKALGAGRPLIASRVPGNEELLEDGETALLTPPGDARSLADTIHLVLSDTQLSSMLAQNARRLAEEKLAWSIVGRMTEALYQEATEPL